MTIVPTTVPPIPYSRRIADLVASRGDEVVLTFVPIDGAELTSTWRELDARSSQIARALADRGLSLGDRLAIGLRNSRLLVEVALAAWKVGAIPVPLRWDLPDWEKQRVLAVIDGRVVLDDSSIGWLNETTDLDASSLPEAVSPLTHGICSSGSTGTPKVVLIDRPGTWDETIGAPFPSAWQPIPVPQTVLVSAPMYHTNGFMTLYNLIAGDRIVLMEKFDAARAVDLVERHRISTLTMTSTMLQRIVDLPGIDDRDWSSVEWVLQGAAVIAPSLVHRMIDLVGAERFFMSYGMTEGLGTACLRGDEWLAHPGSVGRGYRETEIRVLDQDGNDLPPGEIGEIYLRSPSSGLYHYVGGNAEKLRTLDDGFATAGDLGTLDADGYLRIVDRRVDMVVSGGANVYPAEVESALIEHPDIADVVVIGLVDPEWGRRVHAIIEPANPSSPPTADEVIAFAKSKLAAYKGPKTVELIDKVPRSEATKVNRGALVAERGG